MRSISPNTSIARRVGRRTISRRRAKARQPRRGWRARSPWLNLINTSLQPGVTGLRERRNRFQRFRFLPWHARTNKPYNSVGQLLSEGGLWNDDTVSYTYANRLRTGFDLEAPNSASWAQSYGYDAAKRLTSISSPAGEFGYAYDPVRNLQVSNVALPNGAYIRNAYDSVVRLLSTKLVNFSATTLDSQAYAYNQASQRIGETNLAGDFRDYTYDNSGQLLSAIAKEAGGVTNRLQEQLGYLYDPAGNLNVRINNALIQAFNVNAANELTTETNTGSLTIAGATTTAATNVTVDGITANLYADATFASQPTALAYGSDTFVATAHDSVGRSATTSVTVNLLATNTFSYDGNGNLLTDGLRYFTYDDENQLTSVTVSNVYQSIFTYDGRMRRRIRKEFAWFSSAWVKTNEVRYIYDGKVPIQERDINNLPTTTYTRGPDLSGSLQGAGGIGGLLARSDNGQAIARLPSAHAFYHADGNGNVTCLIFTNQQIAARYEYSPFGSILSQSGPLADANLYRFSSKEYHTLSGLICYLYRYYDPAIQRWLNQDPLAELGDIDSYRSMFNSPLNAVDRNGRDNYGSGGENSYSGLVFSQPLREPAANPTPTTIGPATWPITPISQIQPPNPFTYDALLIGDADLIGTPLGYQMAQDNAVTYLTAPGLQLGANAVLGQLGNWGLKLRLPCWFNIPFDLLETSTTDTGPTIGQIIGDVDPDSMIHITTASQGQLANGVDEGSSFVRFGDVSHMTVPQYQIQVVGPNAAGSTQNAVAFVVMQPGSGQFTLAFEMNAAGVREYLSVGQLIPSSYVPLPKWP